ncbi:hypothetical protein EAI_05306 [Harpegnathos saltator]|uniref:Uncharacterized protein n=1 Tax=Harpegnathos saltator TaxID=610380 RepID=E2BPQ5_HARSA|nr:hypothetical protein EAI_05306 [Harpegnathos saltator]
MGTSQGCQLDRARMLRTLDDHEVVTENESGTESVIEIALPERVIVPPGIRTRIHHDECTYFEHNDDAREKRMTIALAWVEKLQEKENEGSPAKNRGSNRALTRPSLHRGSCYRVIALSVMRSKEEAISSTSKEEQSAEEEGRDERIGKNQAMVGGQSLTRSVRIRIEQQEVAKSLASTLAPMGHGLPRLSTIQALTVSNLVYEAACVRAAAHQPRLPIERVGELAYAATKYGERLDGGGTPTNAMNMLWFSSAFSVRLGTLTGNVLIQCHFISVSLIACNGLQ